MTQFVDESQNNLFKQTGICKPEDINPQNVKQFNTCTIHEYGRVRKWKNFLQQPITKDMFINPYEKPREDGGLVEDAIKWQQAEEKRLFDCTKFDCMNGEAIKFNEPYRLYFNDGYSYFIIREGHRKIESLNDLAEATKGQLKLKEGGVLI